MDRIRYAPLPVFARSHSIGYALPVIGVVVKSLQMPVFPQLPANAHGFVGFVSLGLIGIGIKMTLLIGVAHPIASLVESLKEWRQTCIAAVSTQLTKCYGMGELPNRLKARTKPGKG